MALSRGPDATLRGMLLGNKAWGAVYGAVAASLGGDEEKGGQIAPALYSPARCCVTGTDFSTMRAHCSGVRGRRWMARWPYGSVVPLLAREEARGRHMAPVWRSRRHYWAAQGRREVFGVDFSAKSGGGGTAWWRKGAAQSPGVLGVWAKHPAWRKTRRGSAAQGRGSNRSGAVVKRRRRENCACPHRRCDVDQGVTRARGEWERTTPGSRRRCGIVVSSRACC